MSDNPQADTIAFLSRSDTFGQTDAVDRIDTHISHVFLTRDRVYKLKRAVSFPYLDFTTPDRRRHFCEREVRINRRTAPDLYLGTAAVTRGADGELALDGDGAAVDWLVVMHRFDQAALWDSLARTGGLDGAMTDALADRVADFHGQADIHRGADGHSGLAFVIAEENDAELRRFFPAVFPADKVSRLAEISTARLADVGPLLDARAAGGCVRRCHGDMHLGNVCQLDDGPAPFDAIEFNDDFAKIDVLYDIAFLVMDLEHHGLRALANRFFNRYLSATRDYAGIAAMPLFVSLRAAIRAHVTAAKAADIADPTEKAAAEDAARSLLDLALSALESPPPGVVAVGGFSGSGKSLLARALAARPSDAPVPGAVHLQSDVIRKRLAGVAPEERLEPDWYREEVSDRVHDRMAEDAAAALAAGYPVVLDATFMDPARRKTAETVAEAAGVTFLGLWLDVPPDILEARIAARTGDASDADIGVLRQQLDAGTGPLRWQRIDGSGDPEVTVDRARSRLGAAATG